MGAMALFGEKYGNRVRVVKFGSSVELCGGTHVANTGNIGMVRIVNESSIAAGIRRIEAVSGRGMEKAIDDLQDVMTDLRDLLGNAGDLRATVRKAIMENSDLKHQVEGFVAERTTQLAKEVKESAIILNGVTLYKLNGIRIPEIVKNVAFILRKEAEGHAAFVAATVNQERPTLTIMLSDDMVKDGYNASQIVREAAKMMKGGGGGQPFFAQAGGKDVSGLSAAAEKAIELLGLK